MSKLRKHNEFVFEIRSTDVQPRPQLLWICKHYNRFMKLKYVYNRDLAISPVRAATPTERFLLDQLGASTPTSCDPTRLTSYNLSH